MNIFGAGIESVLSVAVSSLQCFPMPKACHSMQ